MKIKRGCFTSKFYVTHQDDDGVVEKLSGSKLLSFFCLVGSFPSTTHYFLVRMQILEKQRPNKSRIVEANEKKNYLHATRRIGG